MGRRPAVNTLMLIFVAILTLPLRAQQKIGAGPAAAGSARAYVAASLPRHGGVKPPLRHADPAQAGSGTTPGVSPSKPFTQDQVSSMVRDGFGDDSGAKLIEQRGVDFTPSDDFIQTLKAAGASEAFLKALRATKRPGAAIAPRNRFERLTIFEDSVCGGRYLLFSGNRRLQKTGACASPWA